MFGRLASYGLPKVSKEILWIVGVIPFTGWMSCYVMFTFAISTHNNMTLFNGITFCWKATHLFVTYSVSGQSLL